MKDRRVQVVKQKIRELERLLSREVLTEVECCGVSLPQRLVLLEVSQSNGISLVELAAGLGLDTSTVSRTVDSLVKLGQMSRVPNPKDRRYILIGLTRRGRESRDSIERSSDALYRRILNSLPRGREEEIVDGLVRLVDEFKKCRQESTCGEVGRAGAKRRID